MVVFRQRTLAAVLVPLLLACTGLPLSPIDPEHEAKVKKMGPEDPQVQIGPLHRPGQSCVVCHADGQEAPAFSVAGTIYRDITMSIPLPDVEVQMIDARAMTFTAVSNCVGNFYLQPSEFTPVSPLWVSLRLGQEKIDMESPIYREWSCAACHTDPTGPASAGHIFLAADDLVAARLPTRPCRPDEGNRAR
jgi:hypothetical protein